MLDIISVKKQHSLCMAKDAKQPWHHLRFIFQKFCVASDADGKPAETVPSKYKDESS